MSEALYRIYRPKTFADLVDQQHIKITLQHALEQDRVAHAYLFAGPHGVGKTTVARLLARAVNCLDRGAKSEPCNKCTSCKSILTGNNLDIVEIDAASQTGVDNVRENVIQGARSIPAMAKKKVFIIDEVHMLSISAFNALLKLLEEPPAHAMFILATTEAQRIPETIISRTQRFDFKRISVDDIVTRLQQIAVAEKRRLDDDVALRIARRASGSERDAESMLGQLFSFAEQRITNDLADLVLPRSDRQLVLQLLQALIKGQTNEALNLFHKYCDEGGDIPHLVHQLIITARGIMLAAVEASLIKQIAPDVDRRELDELIEMSKGAAIDYLTNLVEELLTAEKRVNRAVMAELPVELAFINITKRAENNSANIPPPPAKKEPPTKTPPPATPPSTTKKPARKLSNAGQKIKENWVKIKRQITEQLPSLGLCIQHAQPGELTDEELVIHVPFKLHAQRLSDPKNLNALAGIISSMIDQPVRISIVTAALPESEMALPAKPKVHDAPVTAPASSDLWDQVVASFS